MLLLSSNKGRGYLIFEAFLLLVVISGISGYKWQMGQFGIVAEKTMFPTNYSTLGKEEEWEFRYVQPVLLKFITSKGNNYLEVGYENSRGKVTKFKVYISGSLGGVKIDKVGNQNLNEYRIS